MATKKSNLDGSFTRRLRTAAPPSSTAKKREEKERNAIQPGKKRKKPELPRRAGTR
jgi:hypothetical protein